MGVGGGMPLLAPGKTKAEVPMPRWRGLYTVPGEPREAQMRTHRFSAHSLPMLPAAPTRKTKVLLVACEIVSDTPLTSSPSHLPPLASVQPTPASLRLPLHLSASSCL